MRNRMSKRLAILALAFSTFFVFSAAPAMAAYYPSGHPVCADHLNKWVYNGMGKRHLTNRFLTTKAADYVQTWVAGKWQGSYTVYHNC